MFATLFVLAPPPLSTAEFAMLNALRDRHVPTVRKLIPKHTTLLFVIGEKEIESGNELPEQYLVASSRIYAASKSNSSENSDDKEVRVNLERLAKSITYSQSKPRFKPAKVKSIHNNLTKYTIRGHVAPEVYWELHYDTLRNGQLKIQRICEFDHAPKFVW